MNTAALEIMLAELESTELQVCLAPSKRHDRREWDMIRVCLSRNCTWYRRYCAENPSSRGVRKGKPDTKIRRFNTVRALGQLIAGKPAGKYSNQLLSIARQLKAA